MSDEGQPIRELMWDYVYGLLSEEESREMVARIKSDPQVARLYAEVRLKGELVAQAAVVEDSSVKLTTEGAKANGNVQPAVSQSTIARSGRSGTWLSAIAASALAVLLAAGFLWPRPDERLLARNFVCADVVAPSSLPAGLTNQVAVHTYRVSPSGEAAEGSSAAVQLRLVDSAGKEQFQKSLQTDNSGHAMIEIPGAALEPGTTLEVMASANNSTRAAEQLDRAAPVALQKNVQPLALTTQLPVEPEPQIAYFLAAEPEVDSAKDVSVSTWNFAAFSAKPTPTDEAQTINQLSDARLRDLGKVQAEGATRNSQQFGARAAGRAVVGQLRAENRAKQEAVAEQVAQVVEAGQPVQVDISPALAGKTLDVAVLCRGVTVAATTESGDVATTLRTIDSKANVSQRQVTLPLPPEADGLMEVEVFDQASDEPEPVQRALVYRQPLRKLQVELPAFRDHVAPGEEVELKLRVTDEKGQPAANTRLGIRVWNERLVKQLNERPLLLTDAVLNSAVNDGNAETFALNQSGQRADLDGLAQQANKYQRAMRAPAGAPAANIPAAGMPAAGMMTPQRQMNESQQAARSATVANAKIELASNRNAVKIAIRTATYEAEARWQRIVHGLGVVAVCGGIALVVLVVVLAFPRMITSVPELTVPLITAVASVMIGAAWLGWQPERSGTQIAMAPLAEKNTAREEASSGPAGAIVNTPVPAPAAAAAPVADFAARGGRGPDVAAEAPRSSLSAAPAAARPSMPSAPPSDPTRIGASAGLAGAGLPSSGGLPASKAIGEEKAKEAATEKLAEKKDADKDRASQPTSPTPASLYFNPNLLTDAEGNATVRFSMPAAASEYRLLIDALGQGRIGSRQELLIGGEAK